MHVNETEVIMELCQDKIQQIVSIICIKVNQGGFQLEFISWVTTVAVWPKNPFSLLLTRPQGPQGCQMKQNHSLNMPLEVWCAKIDPKLNKLEKTIKIEKNSSKMSVF